ncbi:MAG: PHP domain-containing protein [Bacteroidota bacterium]
MNNAYYLNCHSYFSLRYGSLSPEQLVDLARSHEIEALALTDIHSTAACFPFIKACQESGIHPVVGMEFRNGDELLYVALAENLDGFQEINEFYSRYQERGDAFPELPPYWSHVFIVYPWERRDKVSLSEREFLGVASDQLGQLLRSRYRHRQQQLVIWQPVSFADKKGHNVHRLLRAIDHNLLLSKLQNRQQAHSREQFVAPAAVAESFSAYPQLIANTQRLLAACQVSFRFGQNHSRQSFTGDKYDDMLLLDKLAREGVERRYHPTARKTAYERLNRELAVIDRLDFNAYYLITWDFVTYGQSRGFFHVGRGSGANSLVAYCLGLSDVDPITSSATGRPAGLWPR